MTSAAPRPTQVVALGGAAGAGHHLVAPGGGQGHGHAAHPAGGPGDQDRTGARPQPVVLQPVERQGGGEPGGAEDGGPAGR